MKKIVLFLSLFLCLVGATDMLGCEMKYITSFAGSSSEYKVKDKCNIVRQETDKMLLQLDHNKDIICLGKIEENGSIIMAYDDAGVIKQIIFKKCNKDKLRNKLYYIYLIGLYREGDIF